MTLSYPFSPWKKSWAEEVAEVIRSQGFAAYLPHIHFSATYVICDVCQEIRKRPLALADASEPNWNVFFEAGFAFGSGKTVVLAEDANVDTEKVRSVFPDYLRATYFEKSELVTKMLEALRKGSLNIAQIVANEQPKQFYLIDPGVRSDDVREIKRTLSRVKSGHFASSDKGMIAAAHSMHSVLRDLRGAGAVVGLLLPRDYKDEALTNARSSFYLGVAVALCKPVLILRKEPVPYGPVDFKESARTFSSLATMRTVLLDWAQAVIEAPVRERPAKAGSGGKGDVLKIDLGNAWAERDPALAEYFLETGQYRRAREARTTVFLGRRGSGKSAVALQLTDPIRQGHGIALGGVRPVEFEMQELQEAYQSVADTEGPHWKLLLGTIWRYLLLSRLARIYIDYYADKADQPPELAIMQRLVDRVPHGEDFVDAVLAVTSYVRGGTEAEIKAFRAEMNRESLFAPFIRLSRDTRARLVIDGLEEGWAAHHEVSRFVVAALIREAEQINQRFDEKVAVILFIRSEIYDVVKLADPDIDKQSRERLQWDTESLVNLLGLRLAYLLELDVSPRDAWLSVFPATVQGMASPDYMVAMTLRRPRELIKFCAAAIEQAQARHSKQVSETDVLTAERTYSEDLLTDLNGEYFIELPDLYTFVLDFAGRGWPMPMEEVRALVRNAIRREAAAGRTHEWHGDPDGSVDPLIRKLYDVGILGLHHASTQIFSYEQKWDTAKATLRRPAQVRYRKKSVRTIWPEPDLVLHPGLRPVLGAHDSNTKAIKAKARRRDNGKAARRK